MTTMSRAFELFTKTLFLIAIPMQAMLWPTVSSICFVCVYGVINIFMYFSLQSAALTAAMSPGLYVFRSEKRPANYIFMIIMFCYFAIYFFAFLTHESLLLPSTTTWLDPSIAVNYTQGSDLPVDVTSQTSRQMRDNPFVWSTSVQVAAPLVTGTIPGAFACGAGGGFKCYAKLWKTPSTPTFWPRDSTFVPFSSQFYDMDVAVTPGPGALCTDLEVYRIVLDPNLNVFHPLDYPASIVASGGNGAPREPVFTPPCNLFKNSSLCLRVSHTFTQQQYAQEVASKCQQYNGKLIFRLPPRVSDIDQQTGKMFLDMLLVSDSAASVELHATWNANEVHSNWFLYSTFWKQVIGTDQVQAWRESSGDADVFFKFLIAVLPVIVSWYYLSVEFWDYVAKGQILFLCIFVELPSILLFLSLGAWLPMAGSIVCVLAVNYEVKRKQAWETWIRPTLLFIKAACNSVQFAWLLTLVAQAGWNAFYYHLSLDQLYSVSFRFIITDQSSPTWVALMLPIILQLNFAFLVGTAICVVLEGVSARHNTLPPTKP